MRWLLLMLVLSASCKSYVHQQPKLQQASLLPTGCEYLVDFLNKNWKKHRARPCHYYEREVLSINERYHDCLVSLTQSQVVGLFGKPDIDFEGSYTYRFHNTCPKDLKGFFFLKFNFKDENILSVENGYMSFSH